MTTARAESSKLSSSIEARRRDESDKDKVNYYFAKYLLQKHKKAIYGVDFCHFLKPGEPIIFATVGSNLITIYECRAEEIIALYSYSDPNQTEEFYCCCWSYDSTYQVLLASAGHHGIIRIIYPTRDLAPMSISGHSGAVNDLKFHPEMPDILLSAGKDHSVRMWNIRSNVCICIFGGIRGHTDQVISIDFDSINNRIISGGADNCILIWSFDRTIKEKIETSFAFVTNGDTHSFPTFTQNFPDYSTRDVHSNYVDCVKSFGNFILSKSLENSIICWKPGLLSETTLRTNCFSKIKQFDIGDCYYWYIKFSLDISKKYMAVGNTKGTIYVWSLWSDNPTEFIELKHPKCTSVIRQIAFSADSKILISVCDDSTVWRWNMSDVTA